MIREGALKLVGVFINGWVIGDSLMHQPACQLVPERSGVAGLLA